MVGNRFSSVASCVHSLLAEPNILTFLSSTPCFYCSNRTVDAESPTFLALGGVPDIREVPNQLSAYDFIGCIGHVVVSGYLLNVATPTKSRAIESGCMKQPTATPPVLPLLTSSCVVCSDVDVGVCDYVLQRLPQSCSQGERARPRPEGVHLVDRSCGQQELGKVTFVSSLMHSLACVPGVTSQLC